MNTYHTLEKINVSCKDKGIEFLELEKVHLIKNDLAQTDFELIYEGDLTLIFSNRSLETLKKERTVLVSSHIDTVYKKFFLKQTEDEIIGTLDNSVTNTILMTQALKPDQEGNFIFAFTGNEEKDARGADETMAFLSRNGIEPMFVVSLDTTDTGFEKHAFTIENYFVKRGENAVFPKKKDLKTFLEKAFEGQKVKFIHDDDAAPDESWQYDEHNQNCFSFCIPVKGIADCEDWMHSSKGVVLKKSAFSDYPAALDRLLNFLAVAESPR